jgi:uridylate kinase
VNEQPVYRRVLIKLSGEAISSQASENIDPARLEFLSQEVKSVVECGIQVALVLGGGNIWRGGFRATAFGMDTAQSHYMGMLATIINALALQDALEHLGVETRALTAIKMDEVAEPYIRRRAIRHMERGRVVILSGGTGIPYFTTDSAAALRAAEIDAEVVLMGKNGVDGVYTADPRQDPTATRFDELTFMDALNRRLEVMDNTALTLCMDNNVPIIVFDALAKGSLRRIILGEKLGTYIRR